MIKSLSRRSFLYRGQLQDIKNRIIEDIEKKSNIIVLNEIDNTEIKRRIKVNPNDDDGNFFVERIFAVNSRGAVLGTAFDSRNAPFKDLQLETLISLLESLEETLN